MTNDTRWIIGTVVVLAGLLSAQIAGVNNAVNARIDDLLDDVNARMDRIEARIDDLRDDVNARMDRIEARMDRIEARFDAFDERLRNVELALGKIDQRLLTIEGVVLPPLSLPQTPTPEPQ